MFRPFVREATELSLKIPAFSLTCTFAMLSFAVHEKEKEGDIACCLSSVHVRVGFDMFGSVIGGGAIRIIASNLPCFGWPMAWLLEGSLWPLLCRVFI